MSKTWLKPPELPTQRGTVVQIKKQRLAELNHISAPLLGYTERDGGGIPSLARGSPPASGNLLPGGFREAALSPVALSQLLAPLLASDFTPPFLLPLPSSWGFSARTSQPTLSKQPWQSFHLPPNTLKKPTHTQALTCRPSPDSAASASWHMLTVQAPRLPLQSQPQASGSCTWTQSLPQLSA